ncbi:hypothetical protein Salat_2902200 [Sesamum alatum]|uniref:Myb/SANT-like domain-containing protein n=1 Tax=Sesamum alatum TaxID=300844 RepID=A0AAE2C857_9LAMI|nr:hypothetical protein Salat_2902200 [Sesamum alatum]
MPNTKRPKAQSKYFYSNGWFKEQDKAFINMLYWESQYEFYIKKLKFARRRYEAFKLVIEDPAFSWNQDTNRVIAEANEWKRLFRVNTLVKAYCYRGEAQWSALRAIFERSGQADDDNDEESLPNLWYNNDSDSNANISDCVFLGIGSPKNDSVAPPEEEVIDLISSEDDSGPE